jgi:hypothetical protein
VRLATLPCESEYSGRSPRDGAASVQPGAQRTPGPLGRFILAGRLQAVLVYLMPFVPERWWLLRTSLPAWFLFLTPNALYADLRCCLTVDSAR